MLDVTDDSGDVFLRARQIDEHLVLVERQVAAGVLQHLKQEEVRQHPAEPLAAVGRQQRMRVLQLRHLRFGDRAGVGVVGQRLDHREPGVGDHDLLLVLGPEEPERAEQLVDDPHQRGAIPDRGVARAGLEQPLFREARQQRALRAAVPRRAEELLEQQLQRPRAEADVGVVERARLRDVPVRRAVRVRGERLGEHVPEGEAAPQPPPAPSPHRPPPPRPRCEAEHTRQRRRAVYGRRRAILEAAGGSRRPPHRSGRRR